jgi:hypothetical protein
MTALIAAMGIAALLIAPHSSKFAVASSVLIAVLGSAAAGRQLRSGGSALLVGIMLAYIQAIGLAAGVLAYLLLQPRYFVFSSGLNFAAYAHALTLGIFLLAYGVRSDTTQLKTGQEAAVSRFGAFFLALLGALGAVGAYLVIIRDFDLSLFLSNPTEARGLIQLAAPTGVSWLLYKLFLPLAAMLVAIYAHRRGRRLLLASTIGPMFVMYVAYGGRLQPILLLLVLAFAYDRFVQRITVARVVAASLVLLTLGVMFAAYRYFSFYGIDLNRERVEATMLRQFSGTVAELGDTRMRVTVPDPRSREVLDYELYTKALPSVLRTNRAKPLGGASFGEYVGRVQGRLDAGGLRVGPIGEWTLGYGLIAAVPMGAVLGVLSRVVDQLTLSRDPVAVIVGIVSASQLIFVFVTGSANLVSSFILVLVTYLFASCIVQNPQVARLTARRLS